MGRIVDEKGLMAPRVSVVMPVYNGEKYLVEAIESILAQTFGDFELIIIDDASQDNTLEILHEYASRDERIRVIENQQNLGISASLNKGLAVSRGEYIARMDADDISLDKRLAVQVDFMDKNTVIGVCGTWVECIGNWSEVMKFPVTHEEIFARLLFENALAHPSVMMRATLFHKKSLSYNESVKYGQDYELWSRAVQVVRMANIDQILLRYRIHSQKVSSRFGQEQLKIHHLIYERLFQIIGFNFTAEDIRLHQMISTYRYRHDVNFLSSSQKLLSNIYASNRCSQVIPQTSLDAELDRVWAWVCRLIYLHPMRILIYLLFHPFRFHTLTGMREVGKRFGSMIKVITLPTKSI